MLIQKGYTMANNVKYLNNTDFFQFLKEYKTLQKTQYIVLAVLIGIYFLYDFEFNWYIFTLGIIGFLFYLIYRFHWLQYSFAMGIDTATPEKMAALPFKYKFILSLSDLLGSIWWIILPVSIVRLFFVDYFFIPSESMLPNYQVSDFVFVDKYNHNAQNLKKGNVIVFKFPYQPKQHFIKRIIAMPKDHIQIDGHQIWINRKLLEQKWVREDIIKINALQFSQDNSLKETNQFKVAYLTENQYSIYQDTQENPNQTHFPLVYFYQKHKNDCKPMENNQKKIDCVLPDGQYFVIGDNRDHSFDSRYWGFVPYSSILGTVKYHF